MQEESDSNPFKSSTNLWKMALRTQFKNLQALDLIFEELAAAISSSEVSSKTIEHNSEDLWDYICFFDKAPDKTTIEYLTAEHRIGNIVISLEKEQDWVSIVQANMKPIIAGRFFVSHMLSNHLDVQDMIPVYINPGRAFGTGEHPTTYLCLTLISSSKILPSYVVDMGCGTGILAFASKKLWPKSKVIAVDIDPVAVEVAKGNALENNVSLDFYTEIDKNHYRKKVDLIIANILSDPIIEMAEDFASLLTINGHLILSGFLENQLDDIIYKFKNLGFAIDETLVDKGWVAVRMSNIDR